MRYSYQGSTRYVALYQGTIEVQRRTAKPDLVLVLTAAAEEGESLAELEQALEGQSVQMKRIAQEAHIEFTRARMALERALREMSDMAPLGPTMV
jgi:F0F1-type ATP synthase epsilon subunit